MELVPFIEFVQQAEQVLAPERYVMKPILSDPVVMGAWAIDVLAGLLATESTTIVTAGTFAVAYTFGYAFTVGPPASGGRRSRAGRARRALQRNAEHHRDGDRGHRD